MRRHMGGFAPLRLIFSCITSFDILGLRGGYAGGAVCFDHGDGHIFQLSLGSIQLALEVGDLLGLGGGSGFGCLEFECEDALFVLGSLADVFEGNVMLGFHGLGGVFARRLHFIFKPARESVYFGGQGFECVFFVFEGSFSLG